MGNSNENEIKTNFDNSLKNIRNINKFLERLDEDLQTLEDKKLLERINKYIINYQKFEGIKRFSIPIIGKSNSGKSTILNNVLNLDEILEVSSGITTKFISIIRHNENLKGKEPKIYNVIFSQRAFLNNKYLYSFEKNGDCLTGNVKDIIKNKNALIEKGDIECLPENYFYIIEAYIPLFENEYKIYSSFFEFMDIPGLNESNEENYEDNIYFRKILPIFINNVKFSIFIFDTMNYQDKLDDIFINYRKGLNSFYEIYKNNDINEQPKNSIIILNKIDQSNIEGGIKEEKKNFEAHLKNNLKINLEENNVCYLSAKTEKYLNKRFKSFDNYLAYINWIKGNNNFIDELIKNMEKDFGIKIKKSYEEDKDENEQLLKSNKYLISEGFTNEINNYDYKYYKKYFTNNLNKKEIKKKEDSLGVYLKNSFKKIYKDFIVNNSENNQLYQDILDYCGYGVNIGKNEESDKNKIHNISINKFFKNENYNENLNCIDKKYEQLKKIEPNNIFINKIYDNYQNKKNYIEKDYKYTIAVFGQYSSGKSALLNSLIGYDLIPESSNHCTKIALIIQYTKSEKDISLFTAEFNKKDNSNYNFIKGELIARGKDNIFETLKEKNNAYLEGDNISFYILLTPIQYLDDFIEEENIKNRVQFIDLPGLNILEKNVEEKMLSRLIEYINLFLYTNNITASSKENEQTINKMLDLIMKRNKYINSVIFILNFIDTIKNPKEIKDIINKFKEDIDKIILKYKVINWDRYINFYSKIMNKNDILCTYFSAKEHKENIKNIHKINIDVKNFESLFKKLNDDPNLEPADLLKKIKQELKQNYINKIDFKNEFHENNIILSNDDLEISNYVNFIINNLKLSQKEFKKNKDNIHSIIKRFIFLKKNVNNSNCKYIDFFQKLKNKISKDFLLTPKTTVFELFLDLNIYFSYISQNIKKYSSKKENDENLFDSTNKIKIIFDHFKKVINNAFDDKIKKIKNLLYKIATEEKDAIKMFNSEIEDLNKFVEDTFNNYLKQIKKENESIIEKFNISLDHIDLTADKNIINQKFEAFYYFSTYGSAYLLGIYWAISNGAEGVLAALFGAFFIMSFYAFVTAIPSYILLVGISKIINIVNRNSKIEKESIEMKNKLISIKNNILDKMEKIYINISENIELLIDSQKNPMNNLIKNEPAFNAIKNEFYDYMK